MELTVLRELVMQSLAQLVTSVRLARTTLARQKVASVADLVTTAILAATLASCVLLATSATEAQRQLARSPSLRVVRSAPRVSIARKEATKLLLVPLEHSVTLQVTHS